MRTTHVALAALFLTAGCGGSGTETSDGATEAGAQAIPAVAGVEGGATATSDATAAAPSPGLAGRTTEISNPDGFSTVLLYHSMIGDTPPIAKWVEEDQSVRQAQPIDKPAARAAAKAKIEAALAAMRQVGSVRVTTNANLSEYDPTYSEYMVRALAPSSSLQFEEFGEQVTIGFGNAQKAQQWSIPPAEAQSVRDRIKYSSDVELDALLKLTGATPTGTGGTITADVVEYELKSRSSGTTIARVAVKR